jgi:hypothetical protein
MNQHYSEADLLETYYLPPGQSMPVMMHLAGCTDCAARYERLERKLRSLAACSHAEKPETFWVRQRMAVMKRAKAGSKRPKIARYAAAAALVVVMGSTFAFPFLTAAKNPPPPPDATVAVDVTNVPTDPWESEELDEFHSIVAWESWDEKNGDQS